MVMRGKVLAFRGFIYRRGELADAGIVDEESIINNCTTPGDSRATMMSGFVDVTLFPQSFSLDIYIFMKAEKTTRENQSFTYRASPP